jgi:hypothetical protein
MSQDCWGSSTEYVLSMWLAEAILHALNIEEISLNDIRFGIDQEIWDRLLASQDPLIKMNMHMILNASNFYRLVAPEDADIVFTAKFRGIDPFVIFNGKRVRLTSTDSLLAEEFQTTKARMAQGWGIKLINAEQYQ